MRVRAALLAPIVFGLFSFGCGKSPRDRLQGTWVGESVQKVHPSQAERAQGWVKGTRVEFAGNKVTVAIPTESARSGTYRVAKAEGDEMDMVFKRPEGGEDKTHMTIGKDGKLVWTLGGGTELVMTKQ